MSAEAQAAPAKTDADMKVAETAKAAEPAKELEGDAPADKRGRATVAIEVDANDSTSNVMPSCGGKILMTLADGGLQYLCGAARANTGVKAGRYLFEAKIVEWRSMASSGGKGPGESLMIGLSGVSSSLFLSENADSCAFNSDGEFMQGKWKTRKGKVFKPYDVVGILVNLDKKCPNVNTVSLFINGVRCSEPQPIPEALHGKAVYPIVNFKNMTLQLNFGTSSLAPLPFTCRMLQDAAKDDLALPAAKKAGKKEILFPVGLPEEGTFRFLDGYLEENPGFTEISDRSIVSWARNSGLQLASDGHYASNDRPGLDFGNREVGEMELRRSLGTAASYYDRNCVVMEVKGNLVSADRKKAVADYDSNTFKKIAVVAIGEPPKAFKDKVHSELLAHKRFLVGEEVKKTKHAEAKERAAKKATLAREKAAKQREKAAEEQAKKAKAEKAKAEKKDDDGSDEEDAAMEEEKKAEEPAEAEEEKEEEEVEEPEETIEEAVAKAQAAVELTAEEKKLRFPTPDLAKMCDMTSRELSSSFSSFSLPTKEEGFDEIRFAWAKQKECEQYLQAWIKDKKLTQRVEDLQPGSWFHGQMAEWDKLCRVWQDRQHDWKSGSKKQETSQPKKRKQDGEDGAEKENKENTEEEEPAADSKVADDFDAEDIDAFDAEDIDNLGNGEPLYAHFAHEDWTLLSLRFELHLLVHAFARDMNDPERSVFHESHVGFYFKRYFKKEFDIKYYKCSTFAELLELIQDVIEISSNNTLGPLLSDDSPMDNFARLTEDARRQRQKLIDAGDESAALKFPQRQTRGADRGGKSGGKGGQAQGKPADRFGYGKPAQGPLVGTGPGGRPGMASGSRVGYDHPPPPSRATYGAPAMRAGYGQGPPPGMGMHGPPGMYGPGPAAYGPPPGYGAPGGYGAPPGYGGSPYAAPPGAYGAPGYGGPPPSGPYGGGPSRQVGTGPEKGPYGGGASRQVGTGPEKRGYGGGGDMPPAQRSRGSYGGSSGGGGGHGGRR